MAEAHQRDVRDDQDRQQGQQACMVLPMDLKKPLQGRQSGLLT